MCAHKQQDGRHDPEDWNLPNTVYLMTVYAPQHGRNDEEKYLFFLQLQEEIDKHRQNEDVIVMGDLNGHVGQRTEGYEQVIGHHGIGQRNTEVDRILNFCNSNGM